VLWGGGAPEFKDQMQAQRILESILGRYNEILRTLQTDPTHSSRYSGRRMTARSSSKFGRQVS
jgi:hypothetical protein